MPATSKIVGTTSAVRALFLLLLVPTLSADLLADNFLRCAMTFFPMLLGLSAQLTRSNLELNRLATDFR